MHDQGVGFMQSTDIGVPPQPTKCKVGGTCAANLLYQAVVTSAWCERGDQTMLPRTFALLLTGSHRIIDVPLLERYAAVVGPATAVGPGMPWKRSMRVSK